MSKSHNFPEGFCHYKPFSRTDVVIIIIIIIIIIIVIIVIIIIIIIFDLITILSTAQLKWS